MKYYHGTSKLFESFDLQHALEGAGKTKFGFGVYLTSSYKSAAHYSAANPDAEKLYVYTVEFLDAKDDNHISFKKAVNSSIIKRTEDKQKKVIPAKVKVDGKLFRKFLASELNGEQQAAEFLESIGVNYISWPYSWKNPELGENVAVFNASHLKITRIDEVKLDNKKQLIPGSEIPVFPKM